MKSESASKRHQHRGVDSVLATVAVVVITLVVSVAVSGFIFGSIGQSQNTALVEVTATSMNGGDFQSSGSVTDFTCSGAASGSWLSVSNSGTATISVSSVTITWAGGNSVFAVDGPCDLGPSGSGSATVYLTFPPTTQINIDAITGQTYKGSVGLSNGVQVLFTGTWQ